MTTTIETITLYRGERSWMSSSDSRERAELFGTTSIPCGWTLAAAAADVLEGIQKLNPFAIVKMEAE